MEKVTNDGVITVEESKTMGTELEVVEGMQFDRGYVSAYMVTDSEKMEAVLEDPYILITDKKISNIQEILPILEKIVQAGRKLMIIAEDVEGEALATLVVNKLRGTFTCVAVKAPGFAIAAKPCCRTSPPLRAARSSPKNSASNSKKTTVDQLGRARQVKIMRKTPSSSMALAMKQRSRPASARSRPRSKKPRLISTVKSSRSAWPSCPAVLPSSKSVPQPKPK